MKNSIINQSNSEKYQWGNESFGWHLVSNDKLSVILEEMEPDTAEQAHYHDNSQQFFYILEGQASVIIGDLHHELNTGDGLHILPRTIHSIKNNSNTKVKFLVISEPHSHNDKTQTTNK